jgi:hypothetical protein
LGEKAENIRDTAAEKKQELGEKAEDLKETAN